VSQLAEQILNNQQMPEVDSLVTGCWDEEIWDVGPDKILEMIVGNKEKFMQVKRLFVGDMTYEENKISWIQQGNYDELLATLPNLESLLINGKIDHPNLLELEIMCGGLPLSAVNDIKTANLPNQERLVLHAGLKHYGYDCTLPDFAALAEKSLFPNLRHLGFLDSQDQDQLVETILETACCPNSKL